MLTLIRRRRHAVIDATCRRLITLMLPLDAATATMPLFSRHYADAAMIILAFR